MKKIIMYAVLAALTLVIPIITTGCGDGDIQNALDPVNIVFVVGIVDNETKLNEGIEELEKLPATPGTDYAFISIEGNPATIGEPSIIPDLSDRDYTDAMMERISASIKADLTERLASYEPTSPEIDIAAATELAVRTLNVHAVEGRQNLLVYYCSGKSTTGLINMLETPIYALDVEASVKAVAEKMTADMSGIDVIFYCCGDTTNDSSQEAFSSEEKDILKEFYSQLFNALGAISVTFKEDLPSTESYHFADTPVSSIKVEETSSQLNELSTEDGFADPIVIPEEQIQYLPDSAEFLNTDTATQAIQPVVDLMQDNPDISILIYSTCAGDADNEELSNARSEKIKSLICAGGVSESRVTVIDVKVVDDPYYKFDLGTGEEAKVNRKTVVLDRSSALGQILYNAD